MNFRGIHKTVLLLPIAFYVAFLVLGCGEHHSKAIDPEIYSINSHVLIANHVITVPFLALEDYAYQQQTFSLDRNKDRENFLDKTKFFLRDSANSAQPAPLDNLSIVVRPYGWNETAKPRPEDVCPLMKRKWAQSVCDNPWSAVQQALPLNRFYLVDLKKLKIGIEHGTWHCAQGTRSIRDVPRSPGQASIICEALVFGGDSGEFHHSVVRIDGDLGAIWTVWNGQNGESAEEMTKREGSAISEFVTYGLGEQEDFPKLITKLCSLRRPQSQNGARPSGCPQS